MTTVPLSHSQTSIRQITRAPFDAADLVRRTSPAIDASRDYLLSQQHAEGFWCGELEGDSILESEYILLLAWLGREQTDVAKQAANYIIQEQLPDGGWAMYPGGAIEISGSVKAYFALKLTGHDPQADYMRRARRAIRKAGGADRVNSFTRFYLALLGQISYRQCPAVPPEAMLLPNWAPINIYRISAWSRTIFVPLSIMWAHKPVRELPEEWGIAELFLEPPEKWPPLKCPGADDVGGLITWDRFFRTADAMLKLCDRWKLRPFRTRALRKAEQWMLARFAKSDGLGAIFPPIVWSVVALKCQGYSDDSEEVQYCLNQLDDLIIREEQGGEPTVRLQPCKSPVWDTAISLRALAATGVDADHPASQKAIDWLLDKEVAADGDWSVNVRTPAAGWYFEHSNEFYPDIDDTIMVMMALQEQTADYPDERVTSACQRARDWVLAMQNRDGGWGAFDRNNDQRFLCHVPFADHNAMIDPSTPDIAARVVESLIGCGMEADDKPVRRAVEFVRDNQELNGAWFGRWGVNYIYGTWQCLVGLAAAGVEAEDPAVSHGAEWLITHQQQNGGWGESADSYADKSKAGQGPTTASQTAWALLGLIAAGRREHISVARGVQYLLDTQTDDGTWEETEFTGTGFPLVFYLKYHLYRHYFPMMALAAYTKEDKA